MAYAVFTLYVFGYTLVVYVAPLVLAAAGVLAVIHIADLLQGN